MSPKMRWALISPTSGGQLPDRAARAYSGASTKTSRPQLSLPFDARACLVSLAPAARSVQPAITLAAPDHAKSLGARVLVVSGVPPSRKSARSARQMSALAWRNAVREKDVGGGSDEPTTRAGEKAGIGPPIAPMQPWPTVGLPTGSLPSDAPQRAVHRSILAGEQTGCSWTGRAARGLCRRGFTQSPERGAPWTHRYQLGGAPPTGWPRGRVDSPGYSTVPYCTGEINAARMGKAHDWACVAPNCRQRRRRQPSLYAAGRLRFLSYSYRRVILTWGTKRRPRG